MVGKPSCYSAQAAMGDRVRRLAQIFLGSDDTGNPWSESSSGSYGAYLRIWRWSIFGGVIVCLTKNRGSQDRRSVRAFGAGVQFISPTLR